MAKSNRKIELSIILGTYNRLKFLKIALSSIREEITGINCEIIVVDGGSNDGSLEWLYQQKDIITIIQHNRGYWRGQQLSRKSWGYFMNLGFKIAKGKYICMLSDDCLVVPGAIKNGLKRFDTEMKNGGKIGAMAFYWRNWPVQKKYWVGTTLGGNMFVNHGLFLHSAMKAVRYADEETYSFYHGDGDLCLKLWQKGYKVVASEDSFIEHFFHANKIVRKTNNEKQKKDWQKYIQKWNSKYSTAGKNEGAWIEKEFFDNTRTARKFLLALKPDDFINIIINLWGSPLYRKYFK